MFHQSFWKKVASTRPHGGGALNVKSHMLLALILLCTCSGQASLIQHLDATITASVTKDGAGKVTRWADQTANGNHAVPAIGTVRHPSASRSATNRAGLDFGTTRNSLTLFSATASDRWLNQSSTNPLGARGFCIFVAFKFDGLSNTCDLFGNMSTINGNGMCVRFSTDGEYLIYWDDNRFARGGKVAVGDTVVLGLNYEPTSGRWTLWDSNQRTIQTGFKPANDFSNTTSFTLGSMTAASNFFTGMVGEVKIYDEALSSAEFQSQRDNLSLKWVGTPPPIATVPPGPGFPNVARTNGALLSVTHPSPGFGARTVGLDFVNGFLLLDSRSVTTGLEGDSIQVWDISNPSSPVERIEARKGVDEHMHTYSWLLPHHRISAGGRVAYNVRDPLKIVRQMPSTGSAINYGSRSLTIFPYQYSGGSSTEIFDTRTGRVLAETLHGFDGAPTPIGNLLIIAGIRGGERGVATYDIGDPANPMLLDFISPTDPVWGDNDPAYEYAFWKHFLVLPNESGRGDQKDNCAFVSFLDPSQLKHVIHMPAVGQGQTSTGLWGRTRYAQFQDNKMFLGSATYNMAPLLNSTPAKPTFLQSYPHDGEYMLPLGNLIVCAANMEQGPVNDFPGLTESFQMRIFAHQAAPDTTGPTVAYHNPPNGAINQHVKSRVGVMVHETLNYATINSTTFRVFPVAGGPDVAGTINIHDKDIITFTPNSDLAAGTTYRVQLVGGGIRDVAGNGITGYSFQFTTGVAGGPPIAVTNLTSTPYPAPVNGTANLSVTASGGVPPLQYSWAFGDGTPETAFSTSASAVSHTYVNRGHYSAVLRVRDSSPTPQTVTRTMVVTVAPPVPSGPVSTKGSQMVVDGTNRRVWTVNPDSNTVTSINADTLVKFSEFAVGKDPRSIAQDASGNLWVTCLDDDRLEVRSTSGVLVGSINFRYGSRPHDVVFNAAKTYAYVTLLGSGRIARINPSVTPLRVDVEVAAGATPTAIAVNSATDKLLVNRFISPDLQGEVRLFNNAGSSMSLAQTIPLALDTQVEEAGQSARGLPNYLADVAIDPFNQFAYVTAKKDNILRGTALDGNPLTFETSVRAMVSKINLATNAEDRSFRLDIDNSSQPTAMVFSPLGDYLFIAIQGNNEVRVMDTFTGQLSATLPTGLAPQGLVFDAASSRLFINSLTDRKVTVYDLASALRIGNFPVAPSRTISTVANELFPADVLRGKQVFYNAADGRMGRDGYMSCAVCHQDGDHDGRVWDFTNRGEGLRNTTNLRGRAGMAHGNVHWSANFNEIQDFDLDIKTHFQGSGFISAGAHPSLGTSNAGRDSDLDALAAYVASLGAETIEKSPNRNTDGSLTSDAVQGKRFFAGTKTPASGTALACVTCHKTATGLTDSTIGTATLHNVGTIKASSGKRLDGLLTGIDTPTLLGVHAGAPYLHDGSAATLTAVFDQFVAGAALGSVGSAHNLSASGYNLLTGEKNQLLAYLSQIDGRGDADFTAPSIPGNFTVKTVNGLVTLDWSDSTAQIISGVSDFSRYNVFRRVIGSSLSLIGTSTTSDYVDTTAVIGITYQYRVTAMDQNDNESPFSALREFTPTGSAPLLTIDEWRQSIFGSAANSGIGADTFDSDNDGLVNLLEFAFGQNPTVASSAQIPVGVISGSNFVISFAEPAGITGITYGVEWSETLLPGSWTAIPDGGINGQHTFIMSVGTKNQFFTRLRVTSP